jgi:aromatic-L-amino-acid decarboxylase
MTLGTHRIVSVLEKSVAHAEYLASKVREQPELELLAPVSLNIVCFRYRGRSASGPQLDALNERIVVQLQESGFCVMSPHQVDGRFSLRVALSNHRTRRDDLDALLTHVATLGASLQAA